MLIRDLNNMDMVDPKWVDTFEEYIPKWLATATIRFIVTVAIVV